MKKRKIGSLILSFVMVSLLFIGCSSKTEETASGETPKEKIVLKLGHTGAPDHPYQKAAEMFAEKVAEKTDGMVEIKIFPSNQLGKQKELVEGAQLGTVDMVLTSDVLLSGFEPKMGALNLPFLFSDYENVVNALNGEAGQELSEALLTKNLKVIGWWENGFRHITNSKTIIENPSDLEGLKIRTPSGTVFVDTFNMLGASATPMSFGELYSALQLNTVDGQENPTTHVLTQKFYEVQDYLSLTYHIHVSEPLIMSKAVYDKLPAEYQEILLEAGKDVSEWSYQTTKESEASEIEEIKAKGMTVTEPNIEKFKEATKVVYEKYEKEFGKDFIDLLKNSGK
ncbi:DctP family TRAP transporter solute-binding subunit [Clostridium sediminicola]|uniref:TRAP transporter substrate-binding protein n=1 Tax=Clostridium sediminicola TaxID=3114879 RepID=UPI0031F26476